MESLTDVTGEAIPIAPIPNRVVSLVPSVTETLFRLGFGGSVVGVTRYCTRPGDARARARVVGGTKSPNIETIESLAPDLILANREENRQQDVERLRRSFRVYVSMPANPGEASEEIRRLGLLIGREDPARMMSDEIDALRGSLAIQSRPFAFVYLIWRNPYMAAGRGTFIDALLTEAGGVNAIRAPRYPEVSIDGLASLAPVHVLLSSEPYPFDDSHCNELSSRLASRGPNSVAIHLVDGELLSWHGARLIEGIPYARTLAATLLSGGSPPSE